MAEENPNRCCEMCRRLLKFTPEARSMKREWSRAGNVPVSMEHTDIDQTVVLLKLKFPGCIIHRATVGGMFMGFEFLIECDDFELHTEGAYELKKYEMHATTEELEWAKKNAGLAFATSEQIRQIFKDVNKTEVTSWRHDDHELHLKAAKPSSPIDGQREQLELQRAERQRALDELRERYFITGAPGPTFRKRTEGVFVGRELEGHELILVCDCGAGSTKDPNIHAGWCSTRKRKEM